MPSRKTKGVPGKCSLPSDYFLKIYWEFCGSWWEFSGNSTGRAGKVGILCFFVVVGGSLVGILWFLVGVCWEFSGNSVGRARKL